MNILSQIQFEDPNRNNGIIKASIHKTGKLGFSSGAQAFMGISEDCYFKVGFVGEGGNEDIYLVPAAKDEIAFKVAKAGDYYYINLKHVFDKRSFDYKNETLIYDIKKQKSENIEYYVLNKRK